MLYSFLDFSYERTILMFGLDSVICIKRIDKPVLIGLLLRVNPVYFNVPHCLKVHIMWHPYLIDLSKAEFISKLSIVL